MKKSYTLLLIFLLNLNIFALNVYLPKAPPSLPLAKTSEIIKELNLKYYIDVNTEVFPSIIKNEESLFVLPVNNAAQLYSKGKKLQLIAILSDGLISIISSKDYPSIKSLNNEDIYIGGQGSSPDVISNYIFEQNKINVNGQYRTSQEISKLIISGKIETAILPEPLASLVIDKNKNLKRVFILKNEWKKINGQNSIPQVGIFATEKTISKNKKLIEKFSIEYKNSLKWIFNNKSEASKYGINIFQVSLSELAFENSINNMNLVYVEGLKAKSSVDTYLNALKKVDKELPNTLPGTDFYKK